MILGDQRSATSPVSSKLLREGVTRTLQLRVLLLSVFVESAHFLYSAHHHHPHHHHWLCQLLPAVSE